ncbi:MAG: helix-turn-helix transcriptional regulator [Vulcanimicrobiota bacterium]
MGDPVRHEFQERLKRLISGAIKDVRNAHGDPVDAGSVAKRVAAELWAHTGPKPHPDPATWVRHVRGQLGLTQDEFANVLEVSRVTVARWETGERVPRPSHCEKIAAAARVTPGASTSDS